MDEFLRVIWTAALSFAALFIVSKIMGKKQIAQLEFVDYAIGISIGSIAAQMSIDSQIPFYHFLAAMAVYLLLDIFLSLISRKSYRLKGIIKGKPIILIEDGKLIYSNLKKTRLDINELLSMCRAKDYFDITEIAYCVFETNGELSILPKAGLTGATCKDLGIQKEEPSLSTDLVIDGNIIKNALKQAQKSESWLTSRMIKNNISSVKEIALATYIEKGDKVIFYRKDAKAESGQ